MDWKSILIAFVGVLCFFGFVIGIIYLLTRLFQRLRNKFGGGEESPKKVEPYSKYREKIKKKEGGK